jgi:hypothetical protein
MVQVVMAMVELHAIVGAEKVVAAAQMAVTSVAVLTALRAVITEVVEVEAALEELVQASA